MARDPGSKWWPLPEAGAPDGHRKTQFIVHSTGDNASADRIRGYFSQEGVAVESTFIVGVTSDDPTLQIMDSTDRADANISASVRAISVEVVGDGTGPFTNWQVQEIIRLGRWARANHAIAPRIIPSEPESGFGWHVMFGAPGPWTTAAGKICPGPVRIHQLKTIIFPAIFAADDEDDFMGLYNSRSELRSDVYNAAWVFPQWTTPDKSRKENPGEFLFWTRVAATQARALAEAAAKKSGLTDAEIKKIAAAVKAEFDADLTQLVQED